MAGDAARRVLEALARELEAHPGERLTTARLARSAGVSEAALYRQFPSKRRMFEGLLEFAEETLAAGFNRAVEQCAQPAARCERMLEVVLRFAERNPGITRLITGQVLVGEDERLRRRAALVLERLETALRQQLRIANLAADGRPRMPIDVAAALLVAVAEGRLQRFVRTGFRDAPLEGWEDTRLALRRAVFGAGEPG